MRNIGVFGGSFNPIHNGHIHLAKVVRDELCLDKVIFVPSSNPPHKDSDEFESNEDRLEMCRLAIADFKEFEVSGYELESKEVDFTVYTIRHFKEVYPNDNLFLLLGSDMLLSFDTWFRFDDILKNVTLAIVSRKKDDMKRLYEKAEVLSAFGVINVLDARPIEISSTIIRKKIRNNEDFSCYLAKSVVKYIRLKNLYSNDKRGINSDN